MYGLLTHVNVYTRLLLLIFRGNGKASNTAKLAG